MVNVVRFTHLLSHSLPTHVMLLYTTLPFITDTRLLTRYEVNLNILVIIATIIANLFPRHHQIAKVDAELYHFKLVKLINLFFYWQDILNLQN